MRLRQMFVLKMLGIGCVMSSLMGTAYGEGTADHIKSVTAMTQVFGEGQKFVAVAVEYDQRIDNAKLSTSTFHVDGRTVTKVYANANAALAERGRNGKYVIVELSPDDAGAAMYILHRGSVEHKKPQAAVTQTGSVFTTSRQTYAANTNAVATNHVVNLIVDEFRQLEYKDPSTGQVLPYNLFIPKNYDKRKSYPLVLFMHDAGVVSTETDITLVQGIGAVIWATPSEQAKHEAFVLAPQYPSQPSSNTAPWPFVQMTVDLVNQVTSEYNIDKKRMYTTGQSLGGSISMQIDEKYPDLFAATYIVASQRDPEETRPLAKQKMWIVVSQGDERAYPGENAMSAVWEQEGVKISRAVWNGRATASEFASDVKKMEAEGNPIKYVALQKGTVVLPGQDDVTGLNHINTWRIAYQIEGIRDWLFKQHK